MDDIPLAGNDDSFIIDLIMKLGTEFSIKDLGYLHYFIGTGRSSHFLVASSFHNKNTYMNSYLELKCWRAILKQHL